MVFQQFALLPWRTVRENVGFGLELRGMAPAERRRVVDEKLQLVGLDAMGGPLRAASCRAGCSSGSGWRARSRPTPTSC